MTNQEKQRAITPWIDPNERVTVDFDNAKDLNAEVLRCSDEVVVLRLETSVPHIKQTVDVPLRLVDVTEDASHYTRDPDRPLRQGRLRVAVRQNRPTMT
jgi:hypothetical protein